MLSLSDCNQADNVEALIYTSRYLDEHYRGIKKPRKIDNFLYRHIK